MQHLLHTEADFALMVLTTAEGPTAVRITEYWTSEILAEVAAGRFPLLSLRMISPSSSFD